MRQVLPVIHHLDHDTTIGQAHVAFAAGADGIFLISHDGKDVELVQAAREIKDLFAGQVGLNLLNASPGTAFDMAAAAGADMLWMDSPGVSSAGPTNTGLAIGRKVRERGRSMSFFGSVAFKYQPIDPDPAAAAVEAAKLGMIPTTSGTATGAPPPIEKVLAMHGALGQCKSLAVASGLTPENVWQYLPYVTHYLVATGVSVDMHHFDENRLAEFVRQVRQQA